MENYMEKVNNDDIPIDLVRTLKVVLKKMPFIIIMSCITCVVVFSYLQTKRETTYSTRGKIYVIDKEKDAITLSMDALEIGSKLVYDYMELIKSRVVLEKVIDQLQLDITYRELKSCVTTLNPADTRIIEISVNYDDKTQVNEILNCIEEVTCNELSKKMGTDKPTILERACEPVKNYTVSVKKYTLLGTLVMVFGLTAFFVLKDMFEFTIRYRREVEEHLQLELIGEIPYISKRGKI